MLFDILMSLDQWTRTRQDNARRRLQLPQEASEHS